HRFPPCPPLFPYTTLFRSTSGGAIPDRGLFTVYLATNADSEKPSRVGELDEEMVYESRPGDVISLGATSWRITEITHDRVLVVRSEEHTSELQSQSNLVCR